MTPSKTIPSALIAAAAALLAVAGAGPALAQAKTSGWTFNPNAPLEVSQAEELAADLQTCSGTLNGNVEINQDRVRLRARTMTTQQAKRGGSCGAINRVEAQGDVFYVTPNERVRADRAVYDVRADTVTFTGGVIVVRDQNVSSSDKLVINLRTNNFSLTGGVHAVLYPESSGQ